MHEDLLQAFKKEKQWLENSPLSSDEKVTLKTTNESFQFPETRFRFINDHYGFRKGCMHVLLGGTGAGKSSITQSLMADMSQTQKIILYSTEETLEQIKTRISLMDQSKADRVEINFNNLYFISEDSVDDAADFLQRIKDAVMETKSSLVFIDNITTSKFYNDFETSEVLLKNLKALIREINISAFVIAHTKKGTRDNSGKIDPTDVRGTATLTNKAEYLYTFQRFAITEFENQECRSDYKVVVNVAKARAHDNQGIFYNLDWNFNTMSYEKDNRMSFIEYNKDFNKRDVLGRRDVKKRD